ncbi:hypothetical protein DDI_2602 [Dickeya dianthicola RNS04.9]|nr:hypothetical protein DDI_2602 [Dickeya dianthicola RNS04.9]
MFSRVVSRYMPVIKPVDVWRWQRWVMAQLSANIGLLEAVKRG